MRDLIGQWRPADGQIALFIGSTLPSARFLANPVNPKGTAYLIPGLYSYKLDMHMGGTPHVAFRQNSDNPVARTKDQTLGNSDDILDFGHFGQDIHAAFTRSELEVDSGNLSSAGSVVISGPPEEKGDGNPSQYQDFATSAVKSGQSLFKMALFTVNDLIAIQSEEVGFPEVRYGSTGKQAQEVLDQLREIDPLQVSSGEELGFSALAALNDLPSEVRSAISGDCGLLTSIDDTTLQALASLKQEN